jgi:hypothetical protein
MKLAFSYVRVGGGGFLLTVWVFWFRLAVLAFILLGRLLLGHFVIYEREWHNRQTNISKL